MKIRNGFVTNSSSSSFIISKRFINLHQLELIENHVEEAENYGLYCDPEDSWSVYDEGKYLSFYTFMDNFSMYEFLEEIGVDVSKIKWE